jgi:hypothetical protein
MSQTANEQTEKLAFNEVRLSDGRIVTIKELVGSDEMVVAAQLGKVFTPDGGGAIVYRSCLVARSIESIDGKPVSPCKSFQDYRDLSGQFKSKDYALIKNKYEELNGEGEEGND